MSQISEIYPNFWLVDVTLPDYSVRGVVIVGEERAVIWDTLTHPDDMSGLKELVGDKPYDIIYSHADWDHIWGTAGLSGYDQIISHRHCRDRFDADVPQTLKKMQADEPGRWDAVQLVAPTQVFDAHMQIELGGLTLELHHLAGHTEDCIVGWIPELGVFLGGDTIETPLPVVNDGTVVEDWLSKLKTWAGHDDLIRSLPSHGTIEGRHCLDQTIRYLETLLGSKSFPVPEGVDDFYQKTHVKNLELVRGN